VAGAEVGPAGAGAGSTGVAGAGGATGTAAGTGQAHIEFALGVEGCTTGSGALAGVVNTSSNAAVSASGLPSMLAWRKCDWNADSTPLVCSSNKQVSLMP
jgi:hypothetical protein